MSAKALVVGNAAWDETWQVADLPVFGESIHARPRHAGPGGKGLNQAVTLARAGIPTGFITAIGSDANGDAIAAVLDAEGLDTCLFKPHATPTDRSLVLVTPSGENAILTTRAAIDSLDESDLAVAIAGPAALCVLQGNLQPGRTSQAFAAAKACGMTIAFNPSPFNAEFTPLVRQTDILFVNEVEARALTGLDPRAAARELAAWGPAAVIVTLGAAGALLAQGSVIETIAAAPARTVDPTGAGDVFMAVALAHGLTHGGLPDARSLAVAARAAALCVARAGTYAALPSRKELQDLMRSS